MINLECDNFLLVGKIKDNSFWGMKQQPDEKFC